jgi:hypothetical protein
LGRILEARMCFGGFHGRWCCYHANSLRVVDKGSIFTSSAVRAEKSIGLLRIMNIDNAR